MRTYRSFFWPAVLILIGVVALLANAGLISTDRLSLLSDMWPLILVLIGLEMIAHRRFQGAAADVAAVLIVLIAAGGALLYVALTPNTGGAAHQLDTSAAIGTLDHASVEVNVGAARITLTSSTALEGDLYRAHIQYSGSRPEVKLDRQNGSLQVSQGNSFGTFQSRRFVLDLQINSNVPWTIQTNSGASTESYELATAHVEGIEINTGSARVDITLGRPEGIVPIDVNGGALTVNLHRPPGTGASVVVSGGAVSLDFDNQHSRGIGSVRRATQIGQDIYKVEVNGGACTVTMDTSVTGS
ncbi:MAG: DUF5668 domain-containing protein [Candidatus Dormibacteraceae bacterium]